MQRDTQEERKKGRAARTAAATKDSDNKQTSVVSAARKSGPVCSILGSLSYALGSGARISAVCFAIIGIMTACAEVKHQRGGPAESDVENDAEDTSQESLAKRVVSRPTLGPASQASATFVTLVEQVAEVVDHLQKTGQVLSTHIPYLIVSTASFIGLTANSVLTHLRCRKETDQNSRIEKLVSSAFSKLNKGIAAVVSNAGVYFNISNLVLTSTQLAKFAGLPLTFAVPAYTLTAIGALALGRGLLRGLSPLKNLFSRKKKQQIEPEDPVESSKSLKFCGIGSLLQATPILALGLAGDPVSFCFGLTMAFWGAGNLNYSRDMISVKSSRL